MGSVRRAGGTAFMDEARVEAFIARVASGEMVTALLEAWVGGSIRAEVDRTEDVRDGDIAAVLQWAPDALIRYRRSQLMFEGHRQASAELWFRPDLLPPAVLTQLGGDVPFGRAVASLGCRRIVRRIARTTGPDFLEVEAVVVTAGEAPIALVREQFCATLIEA